MNHTAQLEPPKIKSLTQLIQDIYAGKLRIPNFQRGYLWKTEQRLDLLRSIAEGIPIGSILIWQTTREALVADDFKTTFPTLPLQKLPGASIDYVLDGHQRLATLYQALSPGLIRALQPRNTPSPPLPNDDDDDDIQPLYYDLAEQSFVLFARRAQKALPPLLPLADLLDPRRLIALQRRIENTHPENAELVYRAEDLAARFRDYQIPVLTLATDALEVAATTFSRINSAGTDMSEADITAALSIGRGLDLNVELNHLHNTLAALGWGDVEPRTLLQTLKAIANLDITEPKPERLVDALLCGPRITSRASQSLHRAVTFLKDTCRVPSPYFLPYSVQLPLLAMRFDQNPTPPPQEIKGLHDWLWWTTFTEWFTVINSNTVNRAEEGMSFMGWTPEEKGNYTPELLNAKVRPYKRFHLLDARARLSVLRLAALQPRDLLGNTHPPLPIDNLLARYGKDAVWSWLDPKDLPSDQTPNSILTVARCLLLDPTTARASIKRLHNEPHRISDEALASHAFPPKAIEALRARDFPTALDLRWEHLQAIESTFCYSLLR